MLLPTPEEERKVVFAIGINKAPGLDGFSGLFFKETWGDVRGDMVGAVVEFFRRAQLLKDFNNTFIALIPKVANPTIVKDFRPISSCNVLLKVVTKILTRRIKGVIGSLRIRVRLCQVARYFTTL